MDTGKIRKEAIIDIAEELFLEHGYEATSIALIAKTLEIAKGLVYYYFDTKEEILNDVVRRMCEFQLSRLLDKMDAVQADFAQALVLLFEEYSSFKKQAIVQDNPESRFYNQYHHTYIRKMHTVINRIVEMGMAEKKLTLSDPYAMIIMVLEGAYQLAFIERISTDDKIGLIETALHLDPGLLYRAIDKLKKRQDLYGGEHG